MLIIGIAGGSGSGKTTVVNKIVDKLPKDKFVLLPQDAYYRDNRHLPLNERQKINFDHPDAIEFELLVEHIKMLKEGKNIKQPIYSYLTCIRSTEYHEVKPLPVIIIEGILVLSDKKLRDLMNMKIFVHTDADERLIRIIKRDTIERGRSVETVLNRYNKTVKPMHLQFIEPSKRYADIIIPHGGENSVAIDILTTKIESLC